MKKIKTLLCQKQEEKATKMNILENMTTPSIILQTLQGHFNATNWRKYSEECKIQDDPRLRLYFWEYNIKIISLHKYNKHKCSLWAQSRHAAV